MFKKTSIVLGLALALVLIGALVVPSVLPAQAQQQNLLTNPNFEPPYENGVANGWAAWYEDSGELCNTKPDDWNFVCRPSWGEELDYNNYGLTLGGSSQHVGAQYIPWHAGVYQTVNVEPGTRVRFTVSGYSRSANEGVPAPSYGGNWIPRMRVGIDPEGRGNWTQGVTWSGENNTTDSWQQLSIEATAGASGKVTVFVSSEFRYAVPTAHQDSWWDNAVLESVQPPATPTPTPRPTSAVPPTPRATSTPRPDGAVVHVVQSGDTLYGIALQYDVPVDQIRRLNEGSIGSDSILVVGQELVIAIPEVTPTPTPAPTEEATAEPTVEPSPGEETPEAPTGDMASFCVSAYHDRNGDMIPQSEAEELLPNVSVTLVGTDGPAGTYTTDGISEPYCFQNLPPGNYVLRQTAPVGYRTSGPSEWGVVLGAGEVSSLQLAYVRSDEPTESPDAPTEESTSETPAEEAEEGGLNNVLNLVIRVSGIIVLVLALVVGGLFIVSRRR
ncbi:MAG: LysM peptidoglycan-binding domain-containing protein [Anaerolineae bacterium]